MHLIFGRLFFIQKSKAVEFSRLKQFVSDHSFSLTFFYKNAVALDSSIIEKHGKRKPDSIKIDSRVRVYFPYIGRVLVTSHI